MLKNKDFILKRTKIIPKKKKQLAGSKNSRSAKTQISNSGKKKKLKPYKNIVVEKNTINSINDDQNKKIKI